MSFLEHLDELRKRIVQSLLGVAIGVGLGFFFINPIVNFILTPTWRLLPAGSRMIYTQPGEAFGLYVQIGLIVGIVLASPWIMYQVWLFIAPGLYANEKRFAVPFVLMSTIGFVGGAAFNHYIIFPLLIGMGLVFQMPTVVFFLAKMRLVTARFLLRNTKYAVLAIFVLAAVITPSGDMITQTIFAAPMLGLYALSILIAWIVTPKREIS